MAIIAAILSCNISCSPMYDIKDDEVSSNHHGIPGALNDLHRDLPDQIITESKCKMYAVLLSLIDPRGRNHRPIVSNVLSMNTEELEKRYGKLSRNKVVELYMVAVDSYRSASTLGKPLVELVECMRQINDPIAYMFTHNPELVLILNLYRQILADPAYKINLGLINLRLFQPAFIESLKRIFNKHLRDSNNPYSGQNITADASTSIRTRPLVSSHRHREQERLRKQRLKILRPALKSDKTLRAKRRRLLREEGQVDTLREVRLEFDSQQREQMASTVRILDTSFRSHGRELEPNLKQDAQRTQYIENMEENSPESQDISDAHSQEIDQRPRMNALVSAPLAGLPVLDKSSSHPQDQPQHSSNRTADSSSRTQKQQPRIVSTTKDLTPESESGVIGVLASNQPREGRQDQIKQKSPLSAGVQNLPKPVARHIMSAPQPKYVSSFRELVSSTSSQERVSITIEGSDFLLIRRPFWLSVDL